MTSFDLDIGQVLWVKVVDQSWRSQEENTLFFGWNWKSEARKTGYENLEKK